MTVHNSPTIHVRHARLSFQDTILFNDLNLTLPAGKWTCLLGPSGVGKSTLLRLIANLSTPLTRVSAEITTDDGHAFMADQVSYMAQTDLLLPWLTVLDNVLLGNRLRGKSSTSVEKALDLLIKVGLQKAVSQYPAELSGGMRQRVALVRTLLQEKPVVLMDEPFSALDAITRFKLQNLAAELLRDKTVFFVTHDPMESLRLADEIVVMSGSPATIHSTLTLNTKTPRDAHSPELASLQAKLFHELTQAYEVST